MNADQLTKVRSALGFIAALDQSGGSTPKALAEYGVDEGEYAGDEEMFDLVHAMRTRIVTDPAFTGDRILAAILFEDTMNRQISGRDAPDFLWSDRGVVPFLKVDKGLADESDGVQLMKPIPDLDELLVRAVDKGVFGTKMRSLIATDDAAGIDEIVAQQFDLGKRILEHGLMPILEPEVDIHSPRKAAAEVLLRDAIAARLDELPAGQGVLLKLSLPDEDDFYRRFVEHPKVVRVVALSGGYSRDEADERLARNHGVIASFSRALAEGLRADQSDEEFHKTLDAAVSSIYAASCT